MTCICLQTPCPSCRLYRLPKTKNWMAWPLLSPFYAEPTQLSCSWFLLTPTWLKLLTLWQRRDPKKSRQTPIPPSEKLRPSPGPSSTISGCSSTHCSTSMPHTIHLQGLSRWLPSQRFQPSPLPQVLDWPARPVPMPDSQPDNKISAAGLSLTWSHQAPDLERGDPSGRETSHQLGGSTAHGSILPRTGRVRLRGGEEETINHIEGLQVSVPKESPSSLINAFVL